MLRAFQQVAGLVTNDFASWFDQQLTERGLSLRDVGAVVGVSPTTVRSWRTGFSRPTWENCEGIAITLGMEPGEVRERAGYSGARISSGEQEPAALTEISQTWRELSEDRRESLLAVARALRDQQRGTTPRRR